MDPDSTTEETWGHAASRGEEFARRDFQSLSRVFGTSKVVLFLDPAQQGRQCALGVRRVARGVQSQAKRSAINVLSDRDRV